MRETDIRHIVSADEVGDHRLHRSLPAGGGLPGLSEHRDEARGGGAGAYSARRLSPGSTRMARRAGRYEAAAAAARSTAPPRARLAGSPDSTP